MTGFVHEINNRIAATRENLLQAQAADEPYLVEVHLGELESLARIAAEHGVEVDGLHQTLTAHGVSTPTSGVLDLGALRRAQTEPA